MPGSGSYWWTAYVNPVRCCLSLLPIGWFSITYPDYIVGLASFPTLIFTGHIFMLVSSAMLVCIFHMREWLIFFFLATSTIGSCLAQLSNLSFICLQRSHSGYCMIQWCISQKKMNHSCIISHLFSFDKLMLQTFPMNRVMIPFHLLEFFFLCTSWVIYLLLTYWKFWDQLAFGPNSIKPANFILN